MYFSGNQKRSYRNSLEVVKKAAQVWKKSNIEFVAQLGDIIDGRAKYNTSSDNECSKVFYYLFTVVTKEKFLSSQI